MMDEIFEHGGFRYNRDTRMGGTCQNGKMKVWVCEFRRQEKCSARIWTSADDGKFKQFGSGDKYWRHTCCQQQNPLIDGGTTDLSGSESEHTAEKDTTRKNAGKAANDRLRIEELERMQHEQGDLRSRMESVERDQAELKRGHAELARQLARLSIAPQLQQKPVDLADFGPVPFTMGQKQFFLNPPSPKFSQRMNVLNNKIAPMQQKVPDAKIMDGWSSKPTLPSQAVLPPAKDIMGTMKNPNKLKGLSNGEPGLTYTESEEGDNDAEKDQFEHTVDSEGIPAPRKRNVPAIKTKQSGDFGKQQQERNNVAKKEKDLFDPSPRKQNVPDVNPKQNGDFGQQQQQKRNNVAKKFFVLRDEMDTLNNFASELELDLITFDSNHIKFYKPIANKFITMKQVGAANIRITKNDAFNQQHARLLPGLGRDEMKATLRGALDNFFA